MNIAFSTFLILIFLLPGIFFRRYYYAEEFSKEYVKESFFEILFSAFVPSLIFQSIWFYLSKLLGFPVDLEVIGNLLAVNPLPSSFQNVSESSAQIIFYHFSIMIAASFAGHYIKQGVRLNKWDRRFKDLRFQNSWHYVLKGEFFDFPRSSYDLELDNVEDIELIFVDALVKTQEGTVIYDGILVDYELSNDGGLEYISFKEVQRRFMKDDFKEENKWESKSKYYQIPGHILVMKYSEIINLNFSYYKLIYDEKESKYDLELVK
ncbi:hypothetical protein A33Q_2757 [Indibacter alkaliphilus LW1]|uniref:Uncharacterized protein n=1 Tax=Indibacter alkaliphilus (strain CCUG 57479 / KCTC 22604 / LW1) TaxID=1189612 RepID=S2DB77_INDAL|nr:hypothetical protein [Indibacter alkaliphilus]EOZ96164.1 hypothetical protein A33Q_2757 [Indibacter alkaliphilus LW1]